MEGDRETEMERDGAGQEIQETTGTLARIRGGGSDIFAIVDSLQWEEREKYMPHRRSTPTFSSADLFHQTLELKPGAFKHK